MKTTVIHIRRMLHIANRLLRAEKPIPRKELLDSLGRHCELHDSPWPTEPRSRERMLQRDINAIEEMFGIRIENPGRAGYRIVERYEDELMAYERFIGDFDMMTCVAPGEPLHRYVLPECNRYVGSENFYPILRAIRESRTVGFDYRNIRTGTVRHHKVEPCFLKEDQMRWYLVGRSERGDMTVYGIERIDNLEITDERFERLSGLDGAALFRDCFGIWDDPSAPVEEVILKYDALDGAFLKSVPLHHSQTILEDTAEQFRISLRIKITNDFVMALLSRSRSLEVIAPAHLRERVRSIFASALDRND